MVVVVDDSMGCSNSFNRCIAGDSYLTQLSQYLGMVLVGLLIPVILARHRKTHQYTSVSSNADDGEDDEVHG